MADVAVLGAGSWGTTFAKVLADGGADTVLWARRPEAAREIDESRRNTRYLHGITLPATLHATSDIRAALDGAVGAQPRQPQPHAHALHAIAQTDYDVLLVTAGAARARGTAAAIFQS